MDRGGIENWLMHLLRRIDRSRYRMDFLVRSGQAGFYQDEVERLGSRMIPCAGHRNPWRYAHRFVDAVRSYGPYDVVHAHLNRYNGMIMRLAARADVPVRIAHCHTDRRRTDEERSPNGRAYLTLMRRWIRRHATLKLAASRGAAEYLYGAAWATQPDTSIVHCGLDVSVFATPGDPEPIRAALGVPPGALVIGHVGRLVREKNHDFLLSIAAAAMRLDRRLCLLLVGSGPLQSEISARARALGIAEKVIFAGSRDDVPALMRSAMDVFVFPSVFEGLPMALVEAQAAGLPCIVSDRVPCEADVVEPLIRRLSLDAPVADWASALLEVAGRRPMTAAEALGQVRVSNFNIECSLKAITQLYEGRA